MNGNGPPIWFWGFVGVWAFLGIGSWYFFTKNRDGQLKRKVLLWGMPAAGVLFLINRPPL